MRRFVLFHAAAPLLLAACGNAGGEWAGVVRDSAGIAVVANPADGIWRPGEGWRVVERLRIGTAEGEPEFQFGQIAGIARGSDGTLYILDQQAQEIRVFDSAGAYLRTVGRPGSGPGELSPAAGPILMGRGDTLLVPDVGLQRVNRFLPDGSEAGSFALSIAEGIPLKWELTADRNLAYQARRIGSPGQSEAIPDLVVVRGTDGAIRDTLVELAVGRSIQFTGGAPRIKLFEAEPVWTISDHDRVLVGVSSEYRIEVRSADGKVTRIFTMPFERLPVTESDRNAFLSFLRETFQRQGVPPAAAQMLLQNMEFADYYPAYANVMAGPDGTTWVQHVQSAATVAKEGGTFSAQDVGAPRWNVFDADGRFLGVVEAPPRFQPFTILDRSIFGIWRDEMDVQYVVRLDIVGPENADR